MRMIYFYLGEIKRIFIKTYEMGKNYALRVFASVEVLLHCDLFQLIYVKRITVTVTVFGTFEKSGFFTLKMEKLV